MPQVRSATRANHLRTLHPIGIIGTINNTVLARSLKKAWPATGTGKFSVGTEKLVAAHRAIIGAFSIVV